MSKIKQFFLKAYLRLDLAIFVILYIPVYIIGTLAFAIAMLLQIFKKPLLFAPIVYIFWGIMWYDSTPLHIIDIIPRIINFTKLLIANGILLQFLGALIFLPLFIRFLSDKLFRISISDDIARLDLRYKVHTRIENDLNKLKQL